MSFEETAPRRELSSSSSLIIRSPSKAEMSQTVFSGPLRPKRKAELMCELAFTFLVQLQDTHLVALTFSHRVSARINKHHQQEGC